MTIKQTDIEHPTMKWNSVKVKIIDVITLVILQSLQLEFEQSIAKAVAKWTFFIPMKILKVDCSLNPEIRIKFVKGYHNDRFKFDGKGGVLAHAFFPSKSIKNPHPVTGDVHLDRDEDWVNEGLDY